MNEAFTNQTLANASVGDTIHDFGSNIKNLFENLKTDKKTMDRYCQGIPVCYNKDFNINDEAAVLASTVSQKTYRDGENTVSIDYSKSKEEFYVAPRNVVKKAYKNQMLKAMQDALKTDHLDNYEITTVNNVKYKVVGATVVDKFNTSVVSSIKNAAGFDDDNSSKTMIPAEEFIKKFGIEDNSVLVVDFAAISIVSILKTGPPVKTRIFYAMTPEVENDPAPKLSIDDDVFYEKGGAELVSMFQKDKGGIVYPYSYSPDNEDKYNYSVSSIVPSENFYSNYIFYLSGLIPRNEKSTKFTTDIKVSHPTKTNLYTSTISNSKIQNSITNTSTEILSLLGLKTPSESDIFRMNTKYQLKRSGDWLQVLACVNLHSKIMQGYSNQKYSEKDLGSVYFVTHDRIALAFALLNGINCIYTHASSFACYVFKAEDAKRDKNIHVAKVRNILNLLGEYEKTREDAKENYKKYMEFYTRTVEEWKQKLDEKCENAREKLYQGNNLKEFNIAVFDGLIHELFETAYIYNAIMFVYSNLKENYAKYVESADKLEKSISVARNAANLEEVAEEKMKEIVEDYKVYSSANAGLLLCLDVNYKGGEGVVVPFIRNMEKAVDEIKKSKYYKSIRSWTWNTVILSRIRNTVESLANIKPMDQNEFLYHLKRLDQKSIVNIVKTFEPLYYVSRDADLLMNYARESIRGKLETMSLKRLEKFVGVVLPFIVEVFIGVGELANDETLEEKLRELVQSEISTMEPVAQTLTDSAIVQENTVVMNLAELDVAGALLLLSREIKMNPMSLSMSISKSGIKRTVGGGASKPESSRIFLEHSIHETIYTLMGRILSIDVKKSPAFYDFVSSSILSIAGIGPLVSPVDQYSTELGQAYGKLQVLDNWLKTQPSSGETRAMRIMVDLLLEKGVDKRKRSVGDSAEGPTKRRRISGGGGGGAGATKPNIYRGNHACFHPLFPLYAICESLYQMSYSLDEEAGFDNSIFYQYINFIAKLANGVFTEILHSPLGQLKATFYGLALRELLISTNMYLHTDIYTKTMGMTREQYLQIQLMSSVLSCPYINTEKSREGMFLHCPLFKDFLSNLKMYEVVETTPNTTVVKARAKIRQIMEKMTVQIMGDRNLAGSTVAPRSRPVSAPMVAAISAKMGIKPGSYKKKTRTSENLTRKKLGQQPVAPAGISTPSPMKPSAKLQQISPPMMVLGKRRKSNTKSTQKSGPSATSSGRTRKLKKTSTHANISGVVAA